MSILDEILERKKLEVEAAKARISPDDLAQRAAADPRKPLGLRAALETGEPPAVIAEIKRRSPSKGLIRPDLEPIDCALAYVEGGAAALSILTDEHFFGGSLSCLAAVRERVELPLLRKDFTIDAQQIDEARVAGADAILLIVSALETAALARLHKYAESLGLDALVEVHDEAELDVAMGIGATLIGVNNRNLATFEVDLGATERLGARLFAQAQGAVTLVAESGIATPEDIDRMTRAGAKGFLVGESLMREADLGAALRQLRRSR